MPDAFRTGRSPAAGVGRMNAGLSRFLRFCVVGGLASVLYVVLASVLTLLWPGFELASSLLAYCACIGVSYFLQRIVTFKSTGPMRFESLRFSLVSVLGLVLSSVIVLVSTSMLALSPYLAYLLVFVTIPITNFLLFSRYVFR
jgi:putative flippase GtrA